MRNTSKIPVLHGSWFRWGKRFRSSVRYITQQFARFGRLVLGLTCSGARSASLVRNLHIKICVVLPLGPLLKREEMPESCLCRCERSRRCRAVVTPNVPRSVTLVRSHSASLWSGSASQHGPDGISGLVTSPSTRMRIQFSSISLRSALFGRAFVNASAGLSSPFIHLVSAISLRS